MIRSDTRWTRLTSGTKKIRPGPRAPSRHLPEMEQHGTLVLLEDTDPGGEDRQDDRRDDGHHDGDHANPPPAATRAAPLVRYSAPTSLAGVADRNAAAPYMSPAIEAGRTASSSDTAASGGLWILGGQVALPALLPTPRCAPSKTNATLPVKRAAGAAARHGTGDPEYRRRLPGSSKKSSISMSGPTWWLEMKSTTPRPERRSMAAMNLCCIAF